ncbi:AAA family ATPase [Azoarcus communis]|uniref:XrtA/PEP-CTERM system-associated ATPase n=1 Tax=Parazoarcus communis TaxID=41977 RepID=UPI001459E669|nr:XrtA/PEP-CTERM system-associated ATPase [Parazoarcus communis]NMG47391.1 AAA family ATPase [Parazoarcus communis]
MYESFFKLRSKPFQLNPDPAFFFGSRGHRRAMAYLEYGLHQSEGFIVITGEIGAGKTTIVRSLLEQLDANKVVAANLVSTQIDAKDILRMVATAFGLPIKGQDKAGLLLALETYLVEITAAGKRALLVVDEAQNLTPDAVEELRMLSNFQLEDHALLQSFLVGQPEFRDVMQSAEMQQLRQRVIASYHLGPLDSEETQSYIEHRLRHVGWADDPIFEPAAITSIYGYTGGIPRRINTLCDRLLLAAFLGDRHVISEQDVLDVIDELKQEFASPRSKGVGGVAVDAALSACPSTLALDRLRASDELIAQAATLTANADLQRLEARIVGLEQSVAATLSILNQLLQAVRRAPTAEDTEA